MEEKNVKKNGKSGNRPKKGGGNQGGRGRTQEEPEETQRQENGNRPGKGFVYIPKEKRQQKQKQQQQPPQTERKRETKSLQSGTGPHLDVNPHDLWRKMLRSVPTGPQDYAPLDRWRPFQSQVPLRDQQPKDSGLEVIAGTHLFIEQYFAHPELPGEGLFIPPRYYNCKLTRQTNEDIIDLFTYVKRIPEDWDPVNLPKLPTMEEIKTMTRPQISKWLSILYYELKKIDKQSEFPQAGDFIYWDMRVAHQNGNQNLSGQVRQTFYHAYLTSGEVNLNTIEVLRNNREMGIHPSDYPKSHALIEQKGYQPTQLSDLGLHLYGYKKWTPETVITDNQPTIILTDQQITFFKRYGYVVIPSCIPRPLINSLTMEIDQMLRKNGIQPENLGISTKTQWSRVCGTFGGMLEFFFLEYQEKIREHPNPFWATVQLLENTWFSENRDQIGFWHPFGDLNPRNLWVYVDRMNYRLPEDVMERISKQD